MRRYLPRVALMLGNFVTGLSILTPAGMPTVLADGLGVGIRQTGLLVTFGAMILCVGSPLVAWLTTRIDRRLLLTTTLAVLVAGQAASAFAPNYAVLLALRLAAGGGRRPAAGYFRCRAFRLARGVRRGGGDR